MPWGRVAGLRARLLLVILLVMAPALAYILFVGIQQRREAAREARQEALVLARGVASSQERLVAEGRQFLSLLAQMEPIRELDGRACGELLRSLQGEGDRYLNLGLSTMDGRVICSMLPIPDGIQVGDRAYFQRAVSRRDFAVGDYQQGRITGQPSLNLAYPLLTADQEVRGVVFAALPLAWIHRRVEEARLPAGSVVTLVDSTSRVLARYPEEEGWGGRSIQGTPLARAIREAGGQGTTEFAGLDGVQRLYAVVPLPGGAQAQVVVGIPARVAYAAANQGLVQRLALLGLLFASMLAVAWWGSGRFILRPLEGLLGATRRLAAGELSARAPVGNHGGEMAELGRAFNEMARALEAREKEVGSHLERISRLNRVYAMLSGINSAILRIRSTEEMLDELCRIAVELGRFPLALVHRSEASTAGVEVVAWSGTPRVPEPLQALLVPADRGQRMEEALEEAPSVVTSLGQEKSEPALAPWRELMRAAGYPAVASLPLRVDGEIRAVFTLFAEGEEFFDEAEMRLLLEMAADTSLRLQYLENERRLEYLTHHDTLTGLPNRALFEDRLRQALLRAQQEEENVAVLAIRLDRFHSLLATQGHHVGDEVLREVARYLQGAVQEGDTVARLGTGEFAVLLSELPGTQAVPGIVNRILSEAPERVRVEEETVFVSLSVGVALFPLDGDSVEALLRNALLARQAEASETAHSIAFHSAAINEQAQEKRRLESALRLALEREELLLYYQPVVDVASRQVVGVESLLRWESPEMGFVSPARFIPVAEETGLINEIGNRIMEEVCRQGRRWREKGFGELSININVSVSQLRESDFVERATRILTSSGFDPERLSLGIEITESGLMENLEEAVSTLRHFRNLGLSVYIDDFGTGYSSLSYLRQLPIDTLKIDTSFVRDLPGDADAVAVVGGIIAMAHSLGLRVIAEGVETEGQFESLRALGCDAVQGFFFARPAEAESIEALFGRVLP